MSGTILPPPTEPQRTRPARAPEESRHAPVASVGVSSWVRWMSSAHRAGQPLTGVAPTPITHAQWLTLLGVVLVAAWVRLHGLDYNTAHVDETINVLIARSYGAGDEWVRHGGIIPWYGAWYLFPAFAGVVEPLGGVPALRAMCGVFGLGTLLAVFGLTRELFGTRAALGAAAFFAVLAPPVHAGRVAFRESGTILFLALGFWLYARAWRRNRRGDWMLSALCLFAAFLCKHPASVFAPPLVACSILAGRRAIRYFGVLLVALHVAYVATYWTAWWSAFEFYRTTRVVQMPNDQLLRIYVIDRLDVWLFAVLAAVALARLRGRARWVAAAMVALGGGFYALNFVQRTDAITYKQATYPLLLLVPVGAYALSESLARVLSSDRRQAIAIGALALLAAFAGRGWHWTAADYYGYWPSSRLLQVYMRGRADRTARILTDDQPLVYYLWDSFDRRNVADAFFFQYQGATGLPAYTAAVRDGYFDYVVFSGGDYGEYVALRGAVTPLLPARYEVVLATKDSLTGFEQRIWRRVSPPVLPALAPRQSVGIVSPASGAVVVTNGPTTVEGVVEPGFGAALVQLDVFTDRWYPQGPVVPVDAESGRFYGTVWLGGGGPHRCHHIVRARVFDVRGRDVGTAASVDVTRASAGGGDPPCTWW